MSGQIPGGIREVQGRISTIKQRFGSAEPSAAPFSSVLRQASSATWSPAGDLLGGGVPGVLPGFQGMPGVGASAAMAPPSDPSQSADQRSLMHAAYGYMGVPYVWGGSTPAGLDCSGFVQQCFAKLGVSLPRTAAEQSRVGAAVPHDQLQTGDRLYFAGRNGHVSHTGIYVGDGQFIHASSGRKMVAVDQLTNPLYQRMYAGARR